MKEKIINWLIKVTKADTNKISDGYHTFEELYEHRIRLWIALCKENTINSWATKRHSDGSVWKGWFLMGMFSEDGKQMTYHLPNKFWKEIPSTIKIIQAPEYDGHTPNDVLKRLKKLQP